MGSFEIYWCIGLYASGSIWLIWAPMAFASSNTQRRGGLTTQDADRQPDRSDQRTPGPIDGRFGYLPEGMDAFPDTA